MASQTSQTQATSSSTPQTASGVAAAQHTAVTQTAKKTSAAKPAGAVKGAVATLRPAKKASHGGVLGTTTRLGSTIKSSHLPFTGLPLWIFALVALALIAAGLVVRRSSAGRI